MSQEQTQKLNSFDLQNSVVSLFLSCPKSKPQKPNSFDTDTVVSLFLLCPKSKPQKPNSFDTDTVVSLFLLFSKSISQKLNSFGTEHSRQSILVMSQEQTQKPIARRCLACRAQRGPLGVLPKAKRPRGGVVG